MKFKKTVSKINELIEKSSDSKSSDNVMLFINGKDIGDNKLSGNSSVYGDEELLIATVYGTMKTDNDIKNIILQAARRFLKSNQ